MVRSLDLELLRGIFTVYLVFDLSCSRPKKFRRPALDNEVLFDYTIFVLVSVRLDFTVSDGKIMDSAL